MTSTGERWRHRDALAGGLCFLPVGLLLGLLIVLLAPDAPSYRSLPLWSAVSAFFSGSVLWALIVVRRSAYTRRAGRTAGLAIVVAVHLLGSSLMFLRQSVCHWVSGGCLDAMGDPPPDLGSGLGISIGYGLLSLVFVLGWVTLPVGMLLGQWLAARQSRQRTAAQ